MFRRTGLLLVGLLVGFVTVLGCLAPAQASGPKGAGIEQRTVFRLVDVCDATPYPEIGEQCTSGVIQTLRFSTPSGITVASSGGWSIVTNNTVASSFRVERVVEVVRDGTDLVLVALVHYDQTFNYGGSCELLSHLVQIDGRMRIDVYDLNCA